MKKLILTIVFVGLISNIYAQQSFYERIQEPDSIFSVYLEEDTLNIYSIFLVFENRSQDSIILLSNFKHYFYDEGYYYEFLSSRGIRMNFYFDKNSVLPIWGDFRPSSFIFTNGRSPVPPLSAVKFPITLPHIGKIRDDIEKSVAFEIFYMYYNVTQKKADSYYITTNELNLRYLKRFEEEINSNEISNEEAEN